MGWIGNRVVDGAWGAGGNRRLSRVSVKPDIRRVLRRNVILLLSAMLLLAGCGQDMHDHPDLVTGEQLFNYHCASCHKPGGQGNFLKGVPANKGTDLSIFQIAHKVQSGAGENSAMPVFAGMSYDEARKIAAYVQRL